MHGGGLVVDFLSFLVKEVAHGSFVVDGFGFIEASSWMAAVAL